MIQDLIYRMKVEKPEERPPEERHEQSDVPIGILTAVIVFLGLLGILSLVLLRILFVHWTGESVSFGPARIDLAIEADNQAPPPRLQVSPEDEWETWKAGELEELNRFGWVSR